MKGREVANLLEKKKGKEKKKRSPFLKNNKRPSLQVLNQREYKKKGSSSSFREAGKRGRRACLGKEAL